MIQRRGGIPRVAVALAVVSCVVAGVSVAAAAEPLADQRVKAQASSWDKPAVAIQTGEKVTWDLSSGDQLFHNVKGTPNPADPAWGAFSVPPAREGEATFTFTQPGSFEFVCEVHPGTMRGVVTVTGSPATPTATPSTTATATATSTATATATATATSTPRPQPTTGPGTTTEDRTTPAPTRSSAADATKPTISAVKLKAVRRGARVSFSLSESSAVTIRFKRGKTTVRTVRLSARAGSRSVTVRSSKLVRARYSVEIEARDARGNRADVQRRTVRVTR